jgi:hypothetical protein
MHIRIAPLVVPFVHQHNPTLQCSRQRKAICRTDVLRFSADAQSGCSPMVNALTKQNIFEMSWINEFRHRPYPPTTIHDLEQTLLHGYPSAYHQQAY